MFFRNKALNDRTGALLHQSITVYLVFIVLNDIVINIFMDQF